MRRRSGPVFAALGLALHAACTPVPPLPAPGPRHPANPKAAAAEALPASTTLSRPLRQAADDSQRPTGRGHR